MPVIAGIHGLVQAGTVPPEPPTILVISGEKMGKSSTAISLFDWPTPGKQPVVIAADPTGPDSCALLGYPVWHVKVRDAPGTVFSEKLLGTINNIEASFKNRNPDHPFSSIVMDCASTMVANLIQQYDAVMTNKQQMYGAALSVASQVFWRLTSLGVPTIWLAWLKEPVLEEKGSGPTKTKRMIEGGPQIQGSFKNLLAGKAHQIVYLEKERRGVGQPGADAQGYVRLFHTRPYANINCNGRYNLPEPMPAHLGQLLRMIMERPISSGPQAQAQNTIQQGPTGQIQQQIPPGPPHQLGRPQ